MRRGQCFSLRRRAAWAALGALATGVTWTAAPAAADTITRLGAIGDSLTDEYAEETYDYARCWTEQLVLARGLSFGPTASQAGQGNWGEPRRMIFEDNWARYGATTDDAINFGQHAGVAQGVTQRGVSHVVINIGGNDFAPWGFGTYINIYLGFWDQNTIDAWIASRAANQQTLLDAVVPSGAEIVLCNVMDFGAMPEVWNNFPDANLRDAVAAAVFAFGAETRAIAAQNGIPFVDYYALNKAIFGENTNLHTTLPIGGVSIALTSLDNGTTPATGWVDDGIHPNTVIQGIYANVYLTALHAGYATNVPVLSEAEILAQAGLPDGGLLTLEAAIGPYSRYVTNYACPGDVDADRDVDQGDLAALLASYESCAGAAPYDPRANLDGSIDGCVTQADLAALLSNYGAACP